MAVTAAQQGITRYVGNYGSNANLLVFWPVDMDTGTMFAAGSIDHIDITIYDDDGTTALLAETTVAARGDGSYGYYLDTSDTATWPVGTEFQVEWGLTNTSLVRTPYPRRVLELFQSVTTPTLVTDISLLEVFADLNDYLGSRSNWSYAITSAWNFVERDIGRMLSIEGIDTYEIADASEYYDLHVIYSLITIFRELRTGQGDRWDLALSGEGGYLEEYERRKADFLASVKRKWEADGTTATDAAERSSIRSHVKTYGISRSDSGDRTNDNAPPITMRSEF